MHMLDNLYFLCHFLHSILFRSIICIFSTRFLVAICFIMIVWADFPALVIARIFNFFVAFSLIALRITRLLAPLTSESASNYCTIWAFWSIPSYFCSIEIVVIVGMIVTSNVSDAPFSIFSYSSIIHRFNFVALLEMV